MKNTAVKFLKEKLEEGHLDISSRYWNELLTEAEAIHEQNIKDSFVAGAGNGEMFNNENRCFVSDADKYYQETFKSE